MAVIFDHTNNIFSGAVAATPADGPLTVTADGVVSNSSASDPALELGGGSWTATINGTVASDSDNGMEFTAVTTGVSKVTVGTTGYVSGEAGMIFSHGFNLTNNGFIGALSGGFGSGIVANFTGDFTITNKGTILGALFGAIGIAGGGIHTIKNSGFMSGVVVQPDTVVGVEKVTNTGIMEGAFGLGDGNDVFKNSGKISASLSFSLGAGNDIFTNTGLVLDFSDGQSPFLIQMGSGNDVFSGGKFVELVEDEAGVDNYKLGDGLDVFDAVGTGSGNLENDTVDGGTNSGVQNAAQVLSGVLLGDTYDASEATFALSINLDTVARAQLSGAAALLDALKATGTDVGSDTLKNFEVVLGGTGSDSIFGNAVGNRLEGGAGNDRLYGGKGNDVIMGGTGLDSIFGELGADTLYGGTKDINSDSNADKFFYANLTDSTLALAGRDTIIGFENTTDKINFSLIASLNNEAFIGTDVAFTPTAGDTEVRALRSDLGWVIQVDADGDGKVDLAINVSDINHFNVWAGTDFEF